MTRNDKTIVCKDCGRSFIFRSDEQDFFNEKGYSEPTRCRDCRAARKNTASPSGFGAPRNNLGSRNTVREMHPATCASCGKPTQVPFLPREGKPVYCSNCFTKQR